MIDTFMFCVLYGRVLSPVSKARMLYSKCANATNVGQHTHVHNDVYLMVFNRSIDAWLLTGGLFSYRDLHCVWQTTLDVATTGSDVIVIVYITPATAGITATATADVAAATHAQTV